MKTFQRVTSPTLFIFEVIFIILVILNFKDLLIFGNVIILRIVFFWVFYFFGGCLNFCELLHLWVVSIFGVIFSFWVIYIFGFVLIFKVIFLILINHTFLSYQKGEEFFQRSTGKIRCILATLDDDLRCGRFEVTTNTQTDSKKETYTDILTL